MRILASDNRQMESFTSGMEQTIERLAPRAGEGDAAALRRFVENFKLKIEDFYRKERQLNIGVIGQVKAGKSSFLNTLLFDGKDVLPKAATPKTATLTKMQYGERNTIQIEYYSAEEWDELVKRAGARGEDEIYTSARELVEATRRNGLDPGPYLNLETHMERREFDSYDDLIAELNNYVGEDGRFTPIVKAVTLYLDREEFKGLSIVDTPGLNDPIVFRTVRTREFMEVCDVVFFLSQASAFLDKSDWVLLSSQLPQKGAKRLVLIASKYDSTVRDVLEDMEDEDEPIPAACRHIKKHLKRHAEKAVEDTVRSFEAMGYDPAVIDVIRQCRAPLLVSALAYNMANKPEAEFSAEERNVYAALKIYSEDMAGDLRRVGNFDEVKTIFQKVAAEKETILEGKARGFIPTARSELQLLLNGFREKAEKRASILEQTDCEQLQQQKQLVGTQIGRIRADIAAVFGELNSKLESERTEGVRALREAGKDYLEIRERTGERTRVEKIRVSDSKWYNPFSWGRSHMETYTYHEQYSYCLAADAVDNLHRYSIEAVNQVEEIFTEALDLMSVKRKLMDVVLHNFDMQSEKYDASIFQIVVEDVVNSIEFPVFQIDISDTMGGILARFSGELTSAEKKNDLAAATSGAVQQIYDDLCSKLTGTVRSFKASMDELSSQFEGRLLEHISKEFELLISQCEAKETEIAGYRDYILLLDNELEEIQGV